MSVENGSDGRIMSLGALRSAVEMGKLDLSRVYLWMCDRAEDECIPEFLPCRPNLSKYLCREQTTGPNTHSIKTGSCKEGIVI